MGRRVKRLPLSGSEIVYDWNPWGKSSKMRSNCYAYSLNSRARYTQKSTPGNHAGMNSYSDDMTDCKALTKRVLADNPKKVYKSHATSRCKKGFYKIMMFVAPRTRYQSGDFHFYKQHGVINYKVKRGDTHKSIAKFFDIPIERVLKAKVRGGHHLHFYRHKDNLVPGHTIQFKANVFSHKQGWATGPLLYDASGKVIKDPRKANRKYGYNYSKYCCSFCVKNKGVTATLRSRSSSNLRSPGNNSITNSSLLQMFRRK
jgi:hypothetical protein